MTPSSFAPEAGHGPSKKSIAAASYSTGPLALAHAPAHNNASVGTGSSSISSANSINTGNGTSNSKSNLSNSASGPGVNNTSNSNRSNTGNSSFRNEASSVFHAHRQNHNSSKLPAFRFADLVKKDPIALPSLLQHMPPSPVSPQPALAELDPDALTSPALLQAQADNSSSSSFDPRPNANTRTERHHDEILRDAHDQSRRIPGSKLTLQLSEGLHHHNHHPNSSSNSNHNHSSSSSRHAAAQAQVLPDRPVPLPLETPQPATLTTFSNPPRARASTFQHAPVPVPVPVPATATTTTSTSTSPDHSYEFPTAAKRPASFPDSPPAENVARTAFHAPKKAPSSSIATPAAKRRLTVSGGVTNGAGSLASTLNSSRLQTAAVGSSHSAHPAENSTQEWAQGQRELLLPKAIETAAKSDEKRKSRPPLSYRPPPSSIVTASSARPVIPPIRAFRSSGSRKSLGLDMHTRRVSDDSYGEDITDPNQRDRTLRALEGRSDDEFSQITPPDSADAMHDNENDNDNDNTADIFMKIAREDSTCRPREEQPVAEDQSAISRITRASHRRPLSAAVPTYQPSSPPQITRRLSDQRETSRGRQLTDGQTSPQGTRQLTYRAIAAVTEKPASKAPATDDTSRTQPLRTPLRPSPITPRQISFQEVSPEHGSAYSRRRQSITESNSGYSANRTTPQYRNPNFSLAQSRTYNSSPLVPKTIEIQKHEPQHSSDANHGVEGTESSTSTAAPSTVWDELDDLKSRIHRLELTGKIPSTSGAAMSRASDDRPPTATTNATTMSASPKRGSGTGAAQPDAISTTSSSKETQPILLSALSKTKSLISPEIFSAIETAATDALALSSMMGVPGQPGPISSGASTIGFGGSASITDRQLRRKADSICRSLTELCIALADEIGRNRPAQPALPRREKEALASPVNTKLAAITNQRRPSALITELAPSKPTVTSPRAPTSLEQRRLTMLNTLALPSPRYAAAPSTPMDSAGAGRKSSLLLTRTRRAGTEEPEEPTGRKSSLLLRTRRAGTEEPEDNREGRKTSLLLRSRKATNDEDEESRFRAPSRAATDVNGFRSSARDYNQPLIQAPRDSNPLESSALPRRRLVPSSLNPRLIAPSQPAAVPARRYLVDRVTSERDSNTMAEKLAEERGQRQFSLSQTAVLNRTGSINRRPRESSIPGLPSPGTQGGGGGYR
ncbi:hypothetical protein B0H63DRAFT_453122 [Podospora didyma]|uniref:LPXTG-motif cell wall anchor domain protein n=1 Tax=Podospora didyma TaxID=330526 RepID=A0AAE0N947_9PEZI|nr:hypothetical protein B0H63DRAFT_453122 [Podospora didyma]